MVFDRAGSGCRPSRRDAHERNGAGVQERSVRCAHGRTSDGACRLLVEARNLGELAERRTAAMRNPDSPVAEPTSFAARSALSPTAASAAPASPVSPLRYLSIRTRHRQGTISAPRDPARTSVARREDGRWE